MSEPDDSPETPPAEPGDSGLFSQLPRTRPGTRSPRRAGGGADKPAAKPQKPAAMRAAAAAAKPKPKPPPKRTEPAPKPRPAPRPADPGGGDAPSGLEELAWAGIAVTAEAATLGVRLLGRAFDAARKATDRADRE